VLTVNKKFFNLNFFFDNIYPADKLKKTEATTTTIAVVNELIIYLDNGIPESDTKLNSSRKLSKVGLNTKKRGGYANSSSRGLKAVAKIYNIGKLIITASGINTIKNLIWLLSYLVGLILVP